MDLAKIPVGVNPPHEVNVIIEVPIGGEPIKYEMDKASGIMVVDRFLYTSMRYPGNYGFIPHTLSEDGDPCDVLVVNTRAITPGAMMSVRPIGALLMEDEAGPDEKIVAVPSSKLTRRYDALKPHREAVRSILRSARRDPVLALALGALATSWDVPALRGFNYRGGFVLVPEFVALFAALSTYTAGFIAEAVRGGILSVRQGQIDAARALGLTSGRIVRLVVIPQAMPVIIPPLTSQYLNLIKNSSFGAAIAYPEIVAVFMGSALVSTGQSIEIIAITLAIYLTLSLAVSLFMNWYNARHRLVTR